MACNLPASGKGPIECEDCLPNVQEKEECAMFADEGTEQKEILMGAKVQVTDETEETQVEAEPQSVHVCTVMGVPVSVHPWTPLIHAYFVILVLINGGHLNIVLLALSFATLLCLFMLVHELAHAFVALCFGARVKGVNITALGGHCYIEDGDLRKAAAIAVYAAGPLSNLLLAAFFSPARGFPMDDEDLLKRMLLFCLRANLFLAVFTLVPAFPLDGGKILAALFSNCMSPVCNAVVISVITFATTAGILYWEWTMGNGIGFFFSFVIAVMGINLLAMAKTGSVRDIPLFARQQRVVKTDNEPSESASLP